MLPGSNYSAIRLIVPLTLVILGCTAILSWAYPPGVGITSNSRSCASCHADTGPWREDSNLIVDIVDANTRASIRQADGSFVLSVQRGQTRRVLTIIGRAAADTLAPPTRNGWAFVDPAQIGSPSLSKFAPGWEVDLPMSCRAVGDTIAMYNGDKVTVVPMTVRPGDSAKDADIELQLMLTTGNSVKGKANEGLIANYHLRRIRLEVSD